MSFHPHWLHDPRGRIEFLHPNTVITLFDRADRTTFLHESAHLFLKVLGDIADRSDSPSGLRDDYAQLLAWLGLTRTADLTEAHHERFAHAIESYVASGEAPVPWLTGVFATFRSWLHSVYKTIGGAPFQITPDTKSLFDRLLRAGPTVRPDPLIAADVQRQLEKCHVPSADARLLGLYTSALFSTLANRADIDATRLYRAYGLRIQRSTMVSPSMGEAYHQPAWHGTAHKVAAFSVHHIGQGEGAQSFGWGLYFAQKRQVAEWYRQNLTAGRQLILDGEVRSLEGAEQEIASRLLPALGNDEESARRAAQLLLNNWHRGHYPSELAAYVARQPGGLTDAEREALQQIAFDIAEGLEPATPQPHFQVYPRGGRRIYRAMPQEDQWALSDINGRVGWYNVDLLTPAEALTRVRQEIQDSIAALRENIVYFHEHPRAWGSVDDLFRMEKSVVACEHSLHVLGRYDVQARHLKDAGRTYAVDIPEDEQLLDWDRPLMEQPTGVQQRLRNHGLWPEWLRTEGGLVHSITHYRIDHDGTVYRPDGREATLWSSAEIPSSHERTQAKLDAIGYGNPDSVKVYYDQLAAVLGSEDDASRYLMSIGIPGHRYLDGSSRYGAEPEPTYNYVIYDDRTITITNKLDFETAPVRARH